MALTRTMKKSTRSNTSGECVECGYADDARTTVAIGDTKNPAPRLAVSREAFDGLLTGIKAGDYDR